MHEPVKIRLVTSGPQQPMFVKETITEIWFSNSLTWLTHVTVYQLPRGARDVNHWIIWSRPVIIDRRHIAVQSPRVAFNERTNGRANERTNERTNKLLREDMIPFF